MKIFQPQGLHPMIKCKFLDRKSILHYKDENFNGKIYDLLESKIKKHYEDRKNIEIEFKSS